MAALMTPREFVRRQTELQQRIARQTPRSLMAQKLRRELRSLVLEELRAPKRPRLAPVPFDDDEEEGQELAWWQK